MSNVNPGLCHVITIKGGYLCNGNKPYDYISYKSEVNINMPRSFAMPCSCMVVCISKLIKVISMAKPMESEAMDLGDLRTFQPRDFQASRREVVIVCPE